MIVKGLHMSGEGWTAQTEDGLTWHVLPKNAEGLAWEFMEGQYAPAGAKNGSIAMPGIGMGGKGGYPSAAQAGPGPGPSGPSAGAPQKAPEPQPVVTHGPGGVRMVQMTNGWVKIEQPTGKPYYHHKGNKITQWDPPAGAEIMLKAPQMASDHFAQVAKAGRAVVESGPAMNGASNSALPLKSAAEMAQAAVSRPEPTQAPRQQKPPAPVREGPKGADLQAKLDAIAAASAARRKAADEMHKKDAGDKEKGITVDPNSLRAKMDEAARASSTTDAGTKVSQPVETSPQKPAPTRPAAVAPQARSE